MFLRYICYYDILLSVLVFTLIYKNDFTGIIELAIGQDEKGQKYQPEN